MTYLTPNHPAVEAATPDIHSISLREYTPEDCHETIADAIRGVRVRSKRQSDVAFGRPLEQVLRGIETAGVQGP